MRALKIFISICFCAVWLSGCSVHNNGEQTKSPLPTLQWYVERYGEVSSPELQSFLSQISKRISAGRSTRIIVLNSSDPMAFTTGGGFIVISAGLIANLRNEAELAFIIAHELSHEILRHTETDAFVDPSGATSKERQEIEMEADKQAVMLLMRANYDPHAALACLHHTYSAFPDLQYSASHPELETRIEALSGLILKSRWTPPGTIDSREFRIFKKMLSNSTF